MENQRTSELIKLNSLGNLNEKDSAELLKLMQTQKDFPWQLLGDYQNLAALFAITAKHETLSPKVKEIVLSGIAKKVAKELIIEDETIKIEELAEIAEVINESPVREKKNREESLSFKDPDLSSLNIFNHSKDFEEVKSRVSKIREQLKETAPVEKHEKKVVHKDDVEDIVLQMDKPRKQTNQGNLKKVFAIAASLFVVTIVVIGFMYFESSGENVKDQTLAVKNENKLLVSNSRVTSEEQTGIVSVENVEQIDPKLNQRTEQDLKTEPVNEPVSKPVEKSEKKENKKTESKEKVNLKPESPKLIEAKLIDPDPVEKKTTTTEQAALIDNAPPPPKEEKKVEEPTFFVAVEEMPEPIGGLKSIQSKITYPDLAKKAGIEGKVFILAYVDESGKVIKAEIVKGIGLGCDEAALNAVLATKFKPGKQRGKPIKVQITIPITFKL